MSGVAEWRPRQLLLLWVGAVLLSAVLYAAIGAFFLIQGLSSTSSPRASDDGPLVVVAFLGAVLAPLATAAGLTWMWFAARKRRRG